MIQLDLVPASNYTLGAGTHTFDITSRPLTFTSSRNYDGTTTVNASALTFTLSNLVAGESLVLSGSGSVTSKDVSEVLKILLWAQSL